MRPHHILLSDRLFCCPDAWVPLSRRQFDKFSNHWNKAGGVRTLDTRGGKKGSLEFLKWWLVIFISGPPDSPHSSINLKSALIILSHLVVSPGMCALSPSRFSNS